MNENKKADIFRPLDEIVSKTCNLCHKSVPLSEIVEYREWEDDDIGFWATCCKKCYDIGQSHV